MQGVDLAVIAWKQVNCINFMVHLTLFSKFSLIGYLIDWLNGEQMSISLIRYWYDWMKSKWFWISWNGSVHFSHNMIYSQIVLKVLLSWIQYALRLLCIPKSPFPPIRESFDVKSTKIMCKNSKIINDDCDHCQWNRKLNYIDQWWKVSQVPVKNQILCVLLF